tara:strand:- start:1460 stop:1648 length:189 start_codon:yes stop_codon:yes gene_type:complete
MVSLLLDTMLFLIKPILLKFLLSNSVRQLVVDLLEAYAKSTDNTIDDAAVELVKSNIFPKSE